MTKKERVKLRRQRKIRRTVTTIALMVLTAVLAIGGTVAWLTDKTTSVVNTFVPSNIDIDLDESPDLDLKMVPGKVLKKDPVVTVKAGSEACWLFVEVKESTGFTNYMIYSVDTGTGAWKQGDGTEIPANVYYRQVVAVPAETAETDLPSFGILTDNIVTVKDTVTKDIMKELATNKPTLTFTAYACQYLGFENDAPGAWENASAVSTPG